MTTDQGTGPSATTGTTTAFFGNDDLLRDFIRERYGDRPPKLAWVGSIPSEEGGGTRYTYSDGSILEGHGSGSWVWTARPDEPSPLGEWDPIR